MKLDDISKDPSEGPALLDCTFRDGGYYNNWDFSEGLFSEYLSAMGSSQVELLEVGFRLPPTRGFRGAHAYSTDEYISSFSPPANKLVGVMVNAGDFAFDPGSVDQLFSPAASSPIHFVRVAVHETQVKVARDVAEMLIAKGYSVAINLMQMSEISNLSLSALAASLDGLPLFSIYLADSLGAMRPEGVAEKIRVMRESTGIPSGLHAHDNLGLAFQNSVVAAECGAKFIDGTVRGMGRGPGNTKTEELAIAFNRNSDGFESAQEIARLANTTWAQMQADLGWGRNLAYFAAGLLGVHPTYVQELLSDSRYDESSVLRIIRSLSSMGAKHFDKDKLGDASGFNTAQVEPESSFSSLPTWAPDINQEAVIFGPGQSLKQYNRALTIFTSKRKGALILFVNDSDLGLSAAEHYRVISHRRQVEANKHFLDDPNCRAIVPQDKLRGVLPESVNASLYNVDFRVGNRLTTGKSYIESPVDNVFAFSCGLARMAGVKRIFIAGFDGIGAGDSRDFDMAEILKEVQKNWGLEIVSLTPTKLPVEVASPLSFRPCSVES